MDKGKVFWHEAFFAALQLELHRYKEHLTFISQHPLSMEALKMDVLIIKKKPDVKIEKNIGRIFRTHNVVEYKSETVTLTAWDYNKVIAYALFYSSFNKVPLQDITITFAVTARPRKLYGYLGNERRYKLRPASEGVTYVEGDVFPVQVLESKRMPPEENLFIKGLRRGIKTDEMVEIVQAYTAFEEMDVRDVYLDRLIQANRSAYKEALNMSEEVKKLFLEVADENGWLIPRLEANARAAAEATAEATARQLLSYGDPIEKIAAVTNLPVEVIKELA